MSCSSCSSTKNGSPRGCQNNGTCGSDSCNKLTVFDWLENMHPPQGEEDCSFVEVRFKNSRKEFFRFPKELKPQAGSLVITKVDRGYDLGTVSLAGALVAVQMKRKKIKAESDKIGTILRLANQEEIDIWQASRAKEAEVQKRARELAIALKLNMKLSDVEFQGDGKKATFYYTADKRVDFRQLIKDMARAFFIRIEMRQIGLREEASRLGGIGSCGRELCCSTWLTDFRSVNTAAARYQQLSLNPQKLAGQCGRLKCCLNYELEVYRSALKAFPKAEVKLQTEKGIGVFQKMDIFKGLIWYAYKGEWTTWHKLTVSAVKEIIEKNKANQKVTSLEAYVEEEVKEEKNKLFDSGVGQDSLKRFDPPRSHSKRNKRRRFESKAKE
ncbi:regulatory iron-sulfur-containing complex subunit RicT [Flavobacteriaceae bacterium]|jgi:cell fate regulator YaaT (PSP1 superfamily)|nr:regulatory iron-sulfur-containing complex subunit RicT [Flavobacteriaceae bacterium]MDA9187777.1 regulatory iron-sulfur-containing complex subunit RicT [Flavobacteriaceae bacterium]